MQRSIILRKKIKLRYDDSIFRFECKFNVKSLSSLANSTVSDDIKTYCRSEGDILFESALDGKALVIHTLVEARA